MSHQEAILHFLTHPNQTPPPEVAELLGDLFESVERDEIEERIAAEGSSAGCRADGAGGVNDK